MSAGRVAMKTKFDQSYNDRIASLERFENAD